MKKMKNNLILFVRLPPLADQTAEHTAESASGSGSTVVPGCDHFVQGQAQKRTK